MPHGGRRPGAGAPKGNLNALKGGNHSQQLKAAIDAMVNNEETRRVLLAIVEKRRRDRIRFQALMIASAKLIHNAELSAAIRKKLEEHLNESE